MVDSYGKSYENLDLLSVRIGNSANRAILVDCGIHAREWISPAFCLHLINDLVGSKSSWTRDIYWVIYPLINPDGYRYTKVDRYWRKNRRQHNGSDCIGVDLNRNYDIDWGTSGVSNDPCAEIYPGTKPFSEPESLAHKNDMLAIKNKVSCRDHRMVIIIFSVRQRF